MEKEFAPRIASEIGIDAQRVIREEAELIFLKWLFESPFSDALVFKEGAALRLLYASARFSEDLDFSPASKISFSEIKKIIIKITNSDDRFSIKDLISKRYTYLAEIRIKEPWRYLSSPLKIKIEISKRPEKISSLDTANLLAQSVATNIRVMTKIVTIKGILKDKISAVQERKM
jgi:predicted nucleotidyltransferase component of viral defense system